MDELPSVDQTGRIGVGVGRSQQLWVVLRRDFDLERLGTRAMGRVVPDGREEVFKRKSGVVDCHNFDVGTGETEAEERSTWGEWVFLGVEQDWTYQYDRSR